METKNKTAIDTSLSSLHFETQEWLREIRFFKDELNYQFDLTTQMIGSSSISDQQHKDIFRNINSLLDKLTNESTAELQQHELNLVNAMREIKTVIKEPFFKKHKVLANKVKKLKEGVIDLKDAIHNYIDENRVQYRTEVLDLDL